MDKRTIEAAILEVAGNPSVGQIKDLAPAMAERICELVCEPEEKASKPKRETRIIGPAETR